MPVALEPLAGSSHHHQITMTVIMVVMVNPPCLPCVLSLITVCSFDVEVMMLILHRLCVHVGMGVAQRICAVRE